MSDNDEKSDDRIPCKYGVDCYQKNPAHHAKFKHPLKRKSAEQELDSEQENCLKKPKEEVSIKHVVSSNNGEETTNPSKLANIPVDYNEEIDLETLSGGIEEKIKSVYSFDMPEDFYSFFKFCKSLLKSSPETALKDAGLILVGPYDILCGKVKKCTRLQAMIHYRYFFDPPEFQTIIQGDESTGFHLGYFRDDPKELPCFVASSEPEKSCQIKCVAGNVFSAVNVYLDGFKKAANPFKKIKIQTIQSSLRRWCELNNFTLDTLTPQMKTRRTKIVTKTFHGAGLVVPYDKDTDVGYRLLAEDDKTLKSTLKDIVDTSSENESSPLWPKLQNVITFANIANDECDFGASLELGIDLFCFGHEMFHRSAKQLLVTSYNLLGRSLYGVIAEAHLENRKKGANVSSIS